MLIYRDIILSPITSTSEYLTICNGFILTEDMRREELLTPFYEWGTKRLRARSKKDTNNLGHFQVPGPQSGIENPVLDV